jgi:outer membrane usher protein
MPEVADPYRRRLRLAAGASAAVVASLAGLSAGAACAEGTAVVATGHGPAVHVVRQGEWIYAIARRYGADPMELARVNGLAAPFVLTPGQRLEIPAGPSGEAAAPVRLAQQTVLIPTRPASPQATPRPAVPTVTVQGAPPAPAPQPGAPVATAPQISAPKRTFTVIVGLKDGPRYIGDVEATISPDGSATVNAGQAAALLKPLLSAQAQEKLVPFAPQGQTALAAFDAAGIKLTYEPRDLQIVAEIPAAARPSQSLSVADLDRALIGQVTPPEPFSGYLNIRSAMDYVEQGSQTGLTSPLVLLDGAVRLHGLVLEGEAQWAPDSDVQAFTRQGTRLVWDDLKHTVRWTAGDLQVQTSGFQGSSEMVGVSVLRLYDELAPQMNVRPRGDRSFTLQRGSTVETFVNGRSVQRVRLDPGTYNLSNFPFVQGANDVHLVITDDAGVHEAIDFSLFFDRTLLRSGLSEFGAFAGVPSVLVNGDVHYESSEPTFTGFYRRGFSDRLTAGFNVQGDTHTQMGGVEGLWGSPLGTVGFDVAVSQDDQAGTGWAVNLGFNRLSQEGGDFRSSTLSATFEMRSENFVTLGSVAANNPYKYQFGLSYGRSFGEYSFATLDARYAIGRGGQEDVGSIRGTVGYRISPTANVSFDVQYATGGFQDGVSFGVQFTKRFGRTSNLRAEYDSEGDTARVGYDTSHGRGVGAWSASGSLERSRDNIGFNGSANYALNRADLGLSHVVTYDVHNSTVADQRTSLRAGTSIAFAGGSVAVGRPIFDSFALFTTHSSLKGAQVVVDPAPDGELARSGALGGAVLNDLGSYSVRTMLYDVPTAPAGYDIGQGSVRVFAPYRSGYHVEVGSDYSILAVGRLLDADGAPIPLLAGRAVELDRKDGRTITLFTSRDGRFGAQGLAPGRWRIEMPTQPPTSYILVVPKGAAALLRVGDLKPDPAGD